MASKSFALLHRKGRGSCPLKALAYSVRVEGMVAEVAVAQEFQNDMADPVEGVYQFPCDAKAAVTGVCVDIGERRVVAVLMEAGKARDAYDDGVASGATAVLVERRESTNDAYLISVGAIPPGGRVSIRLTYAVELSPLSAHESQLVIPLTTMPRYDDSSQNEAPYTVAVTCTRDDAGIKSISSLAHGRYDLAEGVPLECTPDSDVFLHVTRAEAETALPVTCSSNWEAPDNLVHAVAIPLRAAPLAAEDMAALKQSPNTEVVIVLDCSGSMSGEPIRASERVAKYIVQSLPSGCYFNVVLFGSRFTSLFKEPKPLTEESLADMRWYVDRLRADLGGTDLLGPLTALYGKPAREGCLRQILVVTDGAVDDMSAVLRLVEAGSKSTKVYSIGLGEWCSKELVDGLARVGNGVAAYVQNIAHMAAQVMPVVQHMVQPSVTGCCIRSTVLGLRLTEAVIPPVFYDTVHVAYAFAPSEWDPRAMAHGTRSSVFFECDLGTCSIEASEGVLHFAVGGTPRGRVDTEQPVLRRGVVITVPLLDEGRIGVAIEKGTAKLSLFFNRYGVRHNLLEDVSIGGRTFQLEADVDAARLLISTACGTRAVRSIKHTEGSLVVVSGGDLPAVQLGTRDGAHLRFLGDLADAAMVEHNLPSTNGAIINFVYSTGGVRRVVPCVGGGEGHEYTHRMGACRLIKGLEDGDLVKGGTAARGEIVVASIGCGVPSKYTSLVAVDEEGEGDAVMGALIGVEVPPFCGEKLCEQEQCADELWDTSFCGEKCCDADEDLEGCLEACLEEEEASWSEDDEASASGNTPDEIIYLQSFNGSWPLTAHLAALLGADTSDVHQDALSQKLPDTVWMTVLVLRHLIEYHAGSQAEWGMIREKALRFLAEAGYPCDAL